MGGGSSESQRKLGSLIEVIREGKGKMIKKAPIFSYFLITGQPATKKNSATMVHRKGIRPIPTLLPSKAYREYEKDFRETLAGLKSTMPHFDGPVHIKVHYYLKSGAHWPDLLGLEQATADILSDEYKVINHKRTLVKEWVLSDDRIIKSWDGSKIAGIDKANPRVEIWIYPLPLDGETELDPKLRKQAGRGDMKEDDVL